MPNRIDPNDIMNQDFGLLKIVEYVGKKNGVHMYKCRCSCGKTDVIVSRRGLLTGDTRSCGCLHKSAGLRATEDLTGRYFGRWRVIRKGSRRVSKSGKARRTMWVCECECGTVKEVGARALKTGMSTSCGCLQKERVSAALTDDLTGQKFGFLTVKYRNGSMKRLNQSGQAAIWHCECECGQELDVPGWCLKNGDYSSCGCKKMSKYELYVSQYLESVGYVLGVDYFREKTYPDLVGQSGGRLRFDFLVNLHSGESVLIECQGEQHYRAVDWFGGEENFLRGQARDVLKREYALSHGIRLIEMSYTNVLYSDVEKFMKDNGIN